MNFYDKGVLNFYINIMKLEYTLPYFDTLPIYKLIAQGCETHFFIVPVLLIATYNKANKQLSLPILHTCSRTRKHGWADFDSVRV